MDYVAAESYPGKAKADADEMVKHIDAITKLAGDLNEEMVDLVEAEAAFTKKHGDPQDYVTAERKRIFPR